jgi:hypothetical protein
MTHCLRWWTQTGFNYGDVTGRRLNTIILDAPMGHGPAGDIKLLHATNAYAEKVFHVLVCSDHGGEERGLMDPEY